ncbi:hypothetical protein GOODEAATRI_015832 [Goodea atripinnis]|uniref:Uncharacterized protein n=1 Tax=Goodea atripinnis TaxID=208336 RepID=A0ABV0NKM0_9TELE
MTDDGERTFCTCFSRFRSSKIKLIKIDENRGFYVGLSKVWFIANHKQKMKYVFLASGSFQRTIAVSEIICWISLITLFKCEHIPGEALYCKK